MPVGRCRDAHGGVGRVDALPAGAADAEDVDLEILVLISTSTSSASGSTATVAAEVWMRPLASVSGTRCTRWTPLSYLKRLYARRPRSRSTIP